MKIFLSHISRDKPLVREFRKGLPRILDTWLDEDRLSWGDSFPNKLEYTIRQEVDFLIIFLDNDALKSPWVRQELQWGGERERALDRSFILPIMTQKVSSENLPDELKNKHYLELPDYSESSIQRLADTATQHLFRFLAESFSAVASMKSKTIVLYMPLLNVNPFFSTFLEFLCDRSHFDGFNIILKKGQSTDGDIDRSLHSFLEEVRDGPLAGSSVVLFPPHPDSIKDLLKPDQIKAFSDLNVIIMDIDPFNEDSQEKSVIDDKLKQAEYIKSVLALDNRKACDLAAKAIIDSIEGRYDYINVILCDGEYHGRAKFFQEAMCERSSIAKKKCGSSEGIFVHYIPEYKPEMPGQNIRFASAFKDTTKYTLELLENQYYSKEIAQRPTFIFCANDVIALGARAALNRIPDGRKKWIVIIGYDGSSLLEGILDANDPYIRILMRQNYGEYVGTLLNELRIIEGRVSPPSDNRISKRKLISPDVRIESLCFPDE